MYEKEFRGKRIDKDEWVYGWYGEGYTPSTGYSEKGSFISWYDKDGTPNSEEVILETVGRNTGLKDKDGVGIYFGDILLDHQISPSRGNRRIMNGLSDLCWVYNDQQNQEKNVYEVIGNIHENPELSKEIT